MDYEPVNLKLHYKQEAVEYVTSTVQAFAQMTGCSVAAGVF